MAEPSTTPGPEEAEAEATAPEARFAHAPAPEVVAEAEEELTEPEPAPAGAASLAGLSDRPATAAAPEWPVSWLRLVEPEEAAPEHAAVAAVIAAEAADADGVAHAFGQAMAAALDGEPEEPAREPPALETDEPAAEALEASAAAAAAAAEPQPAPDAAEPPAFPTPLYAVRTAKAARAGAAGRLAAQALRAGSPVFEPREVIGRKARMDKQMQEQRAGEIMPAIAVYLLYLASFLLVPAVGGVAIALKMRKDAPDWLESHYVFQIRSFWIGLCAAAISAALLFSGALTLLGLVLGLLLIVWMVARSAIGFISLVKLHAYPRPHAWLI